MSPDPMTPDTEIFEHAPVGLIYSENRVIRRCNLRFAAMFGYGAGSLEGQSLEMLYPSRDGSRSGRTRGS